MDKGGSLSTETYFNILSTGRLRESGIVETIGVELNAAGRFLLSVYSVRGGSNPPEIIHQTVFASDGLAPLDVGISLAVSELGDVVYVRLEAMDDRCTFIGGRFIAVTTRRPPNVISILFSTTVFKREQAFSRNERLIQDYVAGRPELQNACEFIVVDNGRTLDSTGGLFRLIPHSNLGGSGGCARGMLEALRQPGRFTHFVVCDDDVVIEPAILENLYLALRFAGNPEFCVAGSMLRSERKYVQYERGAAIRGGSVVSSKPQLDLSGRRSVRENERDPLVEYGAWWFFCVPVSQIEIHGLPLPFFVRFDDIEFSVRQKAPVITMNGIGVWHDSFEGKDDQIGWYYFSFRNRLVFYAVKERCTTWDVIAVFWTMIRCVGGGLFRFRYRNVEMSHLAIADFLRGPEHVFEAEIENVLARLAPYRYLSRAISPNEGAGIPRVSRRPEPPVRQIFRLLTLNGHLLPPFASGKAVMAPMDRPRPRYFFEARRVLLYDEKTGKGTVYERSLMRMLAVAVRTVGWLAVLALRWRTTRARYRAARGQYSSAAYWSARSGVAGNEPLSKALPDSGVFAPSVGV